jgi:hypothetical protein
VTYQIVPPSGEKKNQISVTFAPVDLLTDPPGYLNVPPAKATVRLAVASFVRTRVNDVALFDVLLAEANVNVQLPVRVAVKTLPSSQSIVTAVPVLPIAVTSSENAPEKNTLESIEITVAALAFWIPVVILGVVSAGLVAKTKDPVPVSSVTAVARFALEGVPRKVATPEPNEVIPVPPLATGSVPVT